MVMNFNMPSQSGVHHDRTPESIMKQRAEDSAKIVEFQKAKSDALARGEEFDAEKYYDQKDREQAEAAQSVTNIPQGIIGTRRLPPRLRPAEPGETAPVVAVQETLGTETAPVTDDSQGSEGAGADAVREALKDAGVEKTEEEIAAEDKALREKAMVILAERRRATIKGQESLVSVRSRLMHTPDAVPMTARTEKPPMPKIDPFQKIEIPGFGEAQILSIDEETQTMYFATPGERANVDSQLVKDQGMSSMNAANFENVIAITPEQARQYIAAANAKRQMVPAEIVVPAKVEAASTRPDMSRYQRAA